MSAPQVNGEDLRRISRGLPVKRVPAQPPAPLPPAARFNRRPAESILDGLRRRKLVDEAERNTR